MHTPYVKALYHDRYRLQGIALRDILLVMRDNDMLPAQSDSMRLRDLAHIETSDGYDRFLVYSLVLSPEAFPEDVRPALHAVIVQTLRDLGFPVRQHGTPKNAGVEILHPEMRLEPQTSAEALSQAIMIRDLLVQNGALTTTIIMGETA